MDAPVVVTHAAVRVGVAAGMPSSQVSMAAATVVDVVVLAVVKGVGAVDGVGAAFGTVGVG